ncbi:hypothetical protein C0991_012437 [Blastosporella zonata]|nr:hypothetical protein C0991_012437 [Blastosporella zonata]
MADEALVVRGFETLLSVPGALATPTHQSGDQDQDTMTHSDVEMQVQAFVSGTDPSVSKAMRNLSRKLEDVEHDIAALQRAMHNADEEPPAPPAPSDSVTSGGWSSWIRSTPASPASPAPVPAPTFGSVMTSPRLRHSPSLNFPARKTADPLGSLGLRVPMPGYIHPQAGPGIVQPRSRTLSTMYMLGLGVKRVSGPSLLTPSGSPRKGLPLLGLYPSGVETATEESQEETDSDDSDVE